MTKIKIKSTAEVAFVASVKNIEDRPPHTYVYIYIPHAV